MSAYAPSHSFHAAANYLSNSSSLSGVSNNTKLELYGLFKYLTVSSTPNTSRPGLLDFAGRAKWDAWKSAGGTYTDPTVVEERYFAIARELGWSEDAKVEAPVNEAVEEDNYDDLDSDTPPSSQRGEDSAGILMGNTVSTMAVPDDEGSKDTLSGLAISGSAEEIESFLNTNPSVDINAKDENGYTPLHLACDRGNAQAAEILLKRGADTHITDPDEYTARELADIAGHDDLVRLLDGAPA